MSHWKSWFIGSYGMIDPFQAGKKGTQRLRPATKGFMKKAVHLLLSRDDFIDEAVFIGPKHLVEIWSYVCYVELGDTMVIVLTNTQLHPKYLKKK